MAEDEGLFLQAGAWPELRRPLGLEHKVVVAHVGAGFAATLVDGGDLLHRPGVAPGQLQDPVVAQYRVGRVGLGVGISQDHVIPPG